MDSIENVESSYNNKTLLYTLIKNICKDKDYEDKFGIKVYEIENNLDFLFFIDKISLSVTGTGFVKTDM